MHYSASNNCLKISLFIKYLHIVFFLICHIKDTVRFRAKHNLVHFVKEVDKGIVALRDRL